MQNTNTSEKSFLNGPTRCRLAGFSDGIVVSDCSVGKYGSQVGKIVVQVGKFEGQVGKITLQVGIGIFWML
jgi:hypothetical protein